MNEHELNQRILAAKERAAGRNGNFDYTVTQGTEQEVKRARRPDGRQDVTVPSLPAPAARDERGRIGDDHTMPDNAPLEPLKIGRLVLYKSGVKGFERVFSKIKSDWELHNIEDGRIVYEPNEILTLIHAEGRRVAVAKVGK